jgi:hypothetical protein
VGQINIPDRVNQKMQIDLFPNKNLWHSVKDGNVVALQLYLRHYSARHYKDGRERKLFCGPGEKMILITDKEDALFVWRKFIADSGQTGVNCAVFRNESEFLSSSLIREAMNHAWIRWPGERLYTYVNPRKIRSSNPGYCFKVAGWRVCGMSKGRLVILEAMEAVGRSRKNDRKTEAGSETGGPEALP